jgi:site-specific DNA-methyltransferase (adenine-specific)
MKIDDILNTVIHDDCLNVMKQLPDKCIDLVLTDPPYGIGINHNMGRRSGNKKSDYMPATWDTRTPDKIYFDEIFRISNNQVIFGANHLNHLICKPSPCWIIWDKLFSNDVSFASAELAYTSFNSTTKKYSQSSARKNGLHPTEKPVNLFRWILDNYSSPRQTFFDPFAGSGTTAIACLETGRNYILIEKEPDYIDIINNRIELWKEQGRMF